MEITANQRSRTSTQTTASRVLRITYLHRHSTTARSSQTSTKSQLSTKLDYFTRNEASVFGRKILTMRKSNVGAWPFEEKDRKHHLKLGCLEKPPSSSFFLLASSPNTHQPNKPLPVSHKYVHYLSPFPFPSCSFIFLSFHNGHSTTHIHPYYAPHDSLRGGQYWKLGGSSIIHGDQAQELLLCMWNSANSLWKMARI